MTHFIKNLKAETMATDCARKDVREWGFGIDTESGG
jgi:hypothetical protein